MNRWVSICVIGAATIAAGIFLAMYVFDSDAGSKSICADINTGQTVQIAGGTFTMGSSDFYPAEAPIHELSVADFDIDTHEVTNAQFAEFVAATGYVTVAERKPDPALYPGADPALLNPASAVFRVPQSLESMNPMQWWNLVDGADWRHPDGPGSDIDDKSQHPVVHIAYADALAYATWKGRALPTEAQWEYVAQSGLIDKALAMGTRVLHQQWQGNTWQGQFPLVNTQADGYFGSAPVGCFPPDNYGIYDLLGNVWEWTSDWYYPAHDISVSSGSGYDPAQPGIPVKTIKGGSFLCSDDYCARYRPSARIAQDAAFSASHIGFRTVSRSTPGAP